MTPGEGMGRQPQVEWVEPEKPKFLQEMEARAANHRPDQQTIRPVARKNLLEEAEEDKPVVVVEETPVRKVKEDRRLLSFDPDDI